MDIGGFRGTGSGAGGGWWPFKKSSPQANSVDTTKPSSNGGGDGNMKKGGVAPNSTHISSSSSSSLGGSTVGGGGKEHETGEFLQLPLPAEMCEGFIAAMEAVVHSYGPDFPMLQQSWKYVENCPNLPPSLAEVGIRKEKREALMKKKVDKGA